VHNVDEIEKKQEFIRGAFSLMKGNVAEKREEVFVNDQTN